MKKTYIILAAYGLAAVSVLLVHQFMYVLPIHLAAFLVAAVGVILSDAQAAWWLYKGTIRLSKRRLEWLHYLVGVVLTTSIVSGALMAWPVWEFLITELSFQLKLGFVFALVVNSIFIGRHVAVASQYSFRELAVRERVPLIVSGVVSTTAWIGAVTAALFLPL